MPQLQESEPKVFLPFKRAKTAFIRAKNKKAFITLGSPVVPLLSTSKADSGLASEFRWDRAIYTAYERMLKGRDGNRTHQGSDTHASRTTPTQTAKQKRVAWMHACAEPSLA